MVDNTPAKQEMCVSSPHWEGPLEEEMVAHSSILAWRIPRMEEPGGLQSTGSHRVGRDCSDQHRFIGRHSPVCKIASQRELAL